MAMVVAYNGYGLNMLNLDLSREANYGYQRATYTNVQGVDGVTYPTGYSVDMNINGTYYRDEFAGNFTTATSGAITGGTVSLYEEYIYSPATATWNLTASLTNFLYSAVDFYNAALSGSQNPTLYIEAAVMSGNDGVYGSTGNDILYGGIGNDIINGGGGVDTAEYMGPRGAYTISQNANGSISVVDNGSGYGDGSDTLYNVSYLQFMDQTVAVSSLAAPPPVAVDFHSLSDILWQNNSGQAAIWDMNGNSVVGGGTVNPNPGPAWKAVGTGDFNDDGHSDILWQNVNGQAAIWEMNGTSVGGGAVSPNPGAAWKAVGTGDFNDDGHSDILWQNANGQAAIWEMNGTNVIGGGAVSPNPGPSWKEIGTGDFNGDGHSDILWQNANGQAAVWEMNGSNVIGGGTVSANPGPNWKEIGTGDFNDDGRSDILWQNSNGQTAIWEMNGTNVIGGGAVGANPGPNWKVVGTGDFNGDGHSDILFQNSMSGQAAIWDMNGTNIVGGGIVSANAGPSWHAIKA